MSPQPAAADFLRRHISQAIQPGTWLAKFEQRLLSETGTRLFDWIDHIYVDAESSTVAELQSTGFEAVQDGSTFEHPTAIFPRVIVSGDLANVMIGIKVESLADFLATHETDIQ